MSVQFPPAATVWLAPGAIQNWLVIGAEALGAAQAIQRITAVQQVTLTASTLSETIQMAGRINGRHLAVAADPTRLPFAAHKYSHCLVGSGIVDQPGETQNYLTQIALSLKPGGHLAVAVIRRDDAVPWVVELAQTVQKIAPKAMTQPEYDLSAELERNGRFTKIEHRAFRLWVPCGRRVLLQMVSEDPQIAVAVESERQQVLSDVAQLYDRNANSSGSLLLPYQVICWRAQIDDHELTEPITSEAIPIHLSSPIQAISDAKSPLTP